MTGEITSESLGPCECQCHACQAACDHKPGWFAPGEAEKAASLLGITLQKFFDDFLVADYWVNTNAPDTFILSPAMGDAKTGSEAPGNPLGKCVFYEAALCKIHAAKPYECAVARHDRECDGVHKSVADMWADKQEQIKTLLGREPRESVPTVMDFLAILARTHGQV